MRIVAHSQPVWFTFASTSVNPDVLSLQIQVFPARNSCCAYTPPFYRLLGCQIRLPGTLHLHLSLGGNLLQIPRNQVLIMVEENILILKYFRLVSIIVVLQAFLKPTSTFDQAFIGVGFFFDC
jgi:hypothetical protein